MYLQNATRPESRLRSSNLDAAAAADTARNLDFHYDSCAATVGCCTAARGGREDGGGEMAGQSTGAVMDHRRWCNEEEKKEERREMERPMEGEREVREEKRGLSRCASCHSQFLRSEAAGVVERVEADEMGGEG